MRTPHDFHELYASGRTPWDIDGPDHNLARLVADGTLRPGSLVDIGCGTGADSVWLAGRGFRVTGIDLVAAALEKARARAAAAGAACEFVETVFPPRTTLPGAPFDLAYDRGCFHSQPDDSARREFAAAVARLLGERRTWVSLVASRDDPEQGDPGPPRLTMAQVVTAVEPFFEIGLVERSFIRSNRGHRHLAWTCLFVKRP